jgi:hypothetical protein
VEANVCGVIKVDAKQIGPRKMVGQCELRNARTKERVENKGIQVLDGGDFLSDIEQELVCNILPLTRLSMGYLYA